MLSKKYRLTKEKDFKRIKASGRSFFSSWFRVRCLNNNQETSRFAVVISTKVSKKASQRNRLRRQIREIIRLNKPKIKEGFDLMISVNNKALDQTYQALEKDLLALLNKAKLLK